MHRRREEDVGAAQVGRGARAEELQIHAVVGDEDAVGAEAGADDAGRALGPGHEEVAPDAPVARLLGEVDDVARDADPHQRRAATTCWKAPKARTPGTAAVHAGDPGRGTRTTCSSVNPACEHSP